MLAKGEIKMDFKGRSFLKLLDYSPEEIACLIELAAEFKYKKKAGINVFVFYKNCYLKLIPCYAVILVLGFAAAKLIPLTGWLGLGVKAVAVGVIFAVTMLVGYTTKGEKAMIAKFAKRLFK